MDPRSLSDLEVLSLTLVGEARGEPIEGQVGVGCVIRNRMHSNPGKYKSFADVCLAKDQFSCWNFSDPNRGMLEDLAKKMLMGQVPTDPYIRQCILVARGVIDWSVIDNTKGALYYLEAKLFADVTSKARSTWAKNPKNEVVIKNHVFFSL